MHRPRPRAAKAQARVITERDLQRFGRQLDQCGAAFARQFYAPLDFAADDAAITRAIIAMAHSLRHELPRYSGPIIFHTCGCAGQVPRSSMRAPSNTR